MEKIGVLIYTYNRVDDARINMEIVRNIWDKSGLFGEKIVIVHAFNGRKEWYRQKYLEDDLIRVKNSWHFQGAADLIDAGMKAFRKKHKNISQVIVLAADTWLIKPEYLRGVLDRMKKDKRYLATCAWGLPEMNGMREVGIATDFFAIDLGWAAKNDLFPLDYKKFYDKYHDLLFYLNGSTIGVEKLYLARFLEAVSREGSFHGAARKRALARMHILAEREPVHSHRSTEGEWIRQMYWPEIGLLTHHDPKSKKEILEKNGINEGLHIQKLLESDSFEYFNGGITTMELNCN